ncbi:aspartate-semialdehyde dehydrogenase, partial [Candidatus Woesearchaeota archaeon]|nr:aspartate-semialdehyde dehydrogenase [Candidatus Woesearchaeota archaeon]
MKKIPVGILGATGMVGQRFVELLENHPWFEVRELAASERSAGKTYEEALGGRWKLSADIPEYARKMKVKACKPNLDCKLVFSALDSSVAGEIEAEFAKSGYIVSSNSKNHRMDEDVPLLIPEVNADHLALVEAQKKKTSGFIVTNPNCSVIGLVLALAPLQQEFGIEQVIVITMQALSGAGYPGVASMDIADNVVPFIGGEEDKVDTEPLKLFGKLESGKIKFSGIKVSSACNRVNVSDGHLESVSVKLRKKPTIAELKKAFSSFNPLKSLKLPSSPENPVVVLDEEDRPQPRRDRMREKGMASAVGRIRPCQVLDYKFVVLSHNTIRGAAGAAILNAELMKVKGLL